ncbi:MAG: hypothetical protein HRT47_01155 [Candidatus Caenarcaniphilales bacterium]|nr:hypothetical protein [Candidatus Caenarcaniphilales bacterium]
MNTDFGGILGSQANLKSQIDRLRSPASTRKVNKMISTNTSIVKGAGSTIKAKTDYQQVMKVRQSNAELRRLDNSISSQQEILIEQNALINKELAEAEAASKEAMFKENPNNSENKKNSSDLTDSLSTIEDAYKYIDTNMTQSAATKLKTYLNTFIFNKPEDAFDTLKIVSPSTTADLLTGIF